MEDNHDNIMYPKASKTEGLSCDRNEVKRAVNKKDWKLGDKFINARKYKSGEDTFIYTIYQFHSDCTNFICARSEDDSCGILFEPGEIIPINGKMYIELMDTRIARKEQEVADLRAERNDILYGFKK